jgi:predicted RNA methylase
MNQTKGLKRNTLDKYYTKAEVVVTCLEQFKANVLVSMDDFVIEPSAGNGAFINGLEAMFPNKCLFYDLEPEHSDIVKQDYLTWEPNDSIKVFHVIGNPPFGRQASLAIQFIKKSCAFASSVSFLLPKSFKKETMQRAFPLSFHLVAQIDVPANAFCVNGKEHDVPCVFQIWIKKDHERDPLKKSEPVGFIFVQKHESPDISFRRVGVNAGAVDKDVANKSEQSHYFIRFTNGKSVDENITAFQSIVFHHDNTAGPRSISKQELIRGLDGV